MLDQRRAYNKTRWYFNSSRTKGVFFESFYYPFIGTGKLGSELARERNYAVGGLRFVKGQKYR